MFTKEQHLRLDISWINIHVQYFTEHDNDKSKNLVGLFLNSWILNRRKWPRNIESVAWWMMMSYGVDLGHDLLNTLRPRQNGRHFADDIFKCIYLNENVWILIKISLTFVSEGPINNISALVQIMAWRRPGDKPLYEPMMVSLLTHICITRTQWVNGLVPNSSPVITWTNLNLLPFLSLRINFSEIFIKILSFSIKKMYLKCHLQNISHLLRPHRVKSL